MFLKYVVASFMILCATCCPEDDCAAVLCEGPPTLAFEIFENGENVFLNGTYTVEDINIIGANAENLEVNLSNASEPNSTLLLFSNSWSPGTFDFEVQFATDTSVTLLVEIINSPPEGCCGGIARLASLTINGSIQERENGFFTVNLD